MALSLIDLPDSSTPSYDPLPHYPPVGAAVASGWAAAVATLPTTLRTLAIDGPAVLDWAQVAQAVTAHLSARGAVELVDLREAGLSWEEIQRRTRSAELADDPHFETLAEGTLADLLDPDRLPGNPVPPGTMRVLLGPGAATIEGIDVLWWADLPKRYAEQAIATGGGRNLLAPATTPASTRRLFYIDWPLLDRHRDAHAHRIDLWLDTQDCARPTWLSGTALRATCADLARRPHRTRPTFNSTPWGGQWARRELGLNPEATNTALGYELIAPESGVLVGTDPRHSVEVPFQLLAALTPQDLLGAEVHRRFGTSFPIRFDYLDTVDGGNLSVHCHPQPEYMRTVFGWPYTQHETYYVMVGGEHNQVFLGLREGTSVAQFQQAARRADTEAIPFDVTEFVQSFPATPHQLFLIPGGTPHGSGTGNVVLEVSATPYLYSLRFYDWLRRDSADQQRPVHVDHAFRNLDATRRGDAVAERLVQRPRVLEAGEGWHEELIGALPEMFFEVRRLRIEPGARAEQDTAGRFHILTLVEGERVMLRTEAGDEHPLRYAETIAIPAAVGKYAVQCLGADPARLVKANVT
ncbi:class I mannose-6-phosphate isomerase [Rugosimonospora acidiphila]|uniref:Class I mannose-6-phosphate isomerase n=1 Tax=Rugosimonospora acidiphila TaxID=556531 RepID=A0ABP9SA89_9ACTN